MMTTRAFKWQNYDFKYMETAESIGGAKVIQMYEG